MDSERTLTPDVSDQWGRSLSHAMPISLVILCLFYYWFAVADRYTVFLYGHLGATPFDEVTSSRYWMSGLVATGIVTVGYTLLNWLLGRIAASRHLDYSPPGWWRVWALCIPALVIGIPAITMTLNWPTLPPANAAACTVVAIVGLALALLPSSLAARRPSDLSWLALDGMGLMPSLLLLRVMELPDRGLIGTNVAYLVALGSLLAGIIWLGIMTALRARRRKPWPAASSILVAGLSFSYLLMPVVHYVLATPSGYKYISTASNFFALSIWIQLLALMVTAVLAVGITLVRRKLRSR
jgi:hypothetical protein